MVRHFALFCLAGFTLAEAAQAEGLFDFDPAKGGAYAGAFAGIAFPGEAELDGRLNDLPSRTRAEFDETATFGIFAGYQLPFKYWAYFQPRLEIEISGFESDLGEARIDGAGQTVSGSQSVTFFLLNNYSDIIWREDQRLVPYIGGGIGVASIDVSARTFPAGDPSTVYRISDDTTALTSTFGAGLSYRVPSRRFSDRFEVYSEARYYSIYDVEFSQQRLPAAGPSASGDTDGDLDGVQLLAGLRVRF